MLPEGAKPPRATFANGLIFLSSYFFILSVLLLFLPMNLNYKSQGWISIITGNCINQEHQYCSLVMRIVPFTFTTHCVTGISPIQKFLHVCTKLHFWYCPFDTENVVYSHAAARFTSCPPKSHNSLGFPVYVVYIFLVLCVFICV